MEQYPVIIIGAGIGGLSTAAYLSTHGVPSLLIEQTPHTGGRCSTRCINGRTYETGALYVGGGVYDHLRYTFGVSCDTYPVRSIVKIGGSGVSIPMSWKTIFELKRCGAEWVEIVRFLYRSRRLSDPSLFEDYESVGSLIDGLTSCAVIRQFLNTLFGVSGIHTTRLPPFYLSKNSDLNSYRADRAEYFPEGNGKITEILSGIAGHMCQIVLNVKAEKILIKNKSAYGVETNRGVFQGKAIVSNAGLRETVLQLAGRDIWEEAYYRDIQKMQETLSVANIFLLIDGSFKIPDGYSVFFVGEDVNRAFDALEMGRFPDKPHFVIHVPVWGAQPAIEDYTATLQFYYPRGNVDERQRDDHVHDVLTAGLEKLFAGFSKAVKNAEVYDPVRYEREFGFRPRVFGVSPDVSVRRYPIQMPVNDLYCVGDSVEPVGPCVPQAMESGIACARSIMTDHGF